MRYQRMNKQDAARIIRKVKAQIIDRTAWCKNSFALDEMGRNIYPESPHACRWCIMGAIRKVRSKEEIVFITSNIYDYIVNNIPDDLITAGHTYLNTINDHLGFDEVHRVLDNAIKNLET